MVAGDLIGCAALEILQATVKRVAVVEVWNSSSQRAWSDPSQCDQHPDPAEQAFASA